LKEDFMQGNQSGPSQLISLQVPHETLKADLENFRQKTLELGASLAEIIPANWVEIDERVRLKYPYPLKARPSMEGVGMDVYGLVTRAGWEIYPIYRSVVPKEVPRALSVGAVFIQ
jgi:hypothetical protein